MAEYIWIDSEYVKDENMEELAVAFLLTHRLQQWWSPLQVANVAREGLLSQ